MQNSKKLNYTTIFIAQMKLKNKLIEEKYNDIFVTNDNENIKASKQELLEMLVDYLPKRFPDKFELQDGGIHNKMGKNAKFLTIQSRKFL